MVLHKTLSVQSEARPTFHDVTDGVLAAVRESGVQNGICVVYSQHTTCSVLIQEQSDGILASRPRGEDLDGFLAESGHGLPRALQAAVGHLRQRELSPALIAPERFLHAGRIPFNVEKIVP